MGERSGCIVGWPEMNNSLILVRHRLREMFCSYSHYAISVALLTLSSRMVEWRAKISRLVLLHPVEMRPQPVLQIVDTKFSV